MQGFTGFEQGAYFFKLKVPRPGLYHLVFTPGPCLHEPPCRSSWLFAHTETGTMEMNEAEDLTEDSETAQKPKAPKKVFVPHPTFPALKTTIVGIAGKT